MNKIFTLAIGLFLLSFVSKAQLIADFESFHNYTALNPFITLSAPDGWNGSDSLIVYFGTLTNPTGSFKSQIKKVTGQTGTGALHVETKIQDSFPTLKPYGPLAGICLNGKLNADLSGNFSISGGYPMPNRVLTMSYWYKTVCKGTDSTSIVATLIDTSGGVENVIARSENSYGTDVNTWTQVNSNFNYMAGTDTLTPDILRLFISTAGVGFDLANITSATFFDSTWIEVDQISITTNLGISETIYNSGLVKFSNPANNTLNVQLTKDENVTCNLINSLGATVKSFSLNNQINKIDISELNTGMYTLQVSNAKKIVVQSSKLLIE